MTASERTVIHRCAAELHADFVGIFGVETIEAVLESSFDELAGRAPSVSPFRLVLVERFAKERLRALARARGAVDHELPAVLFVCTHNAGRSQMALGWFEHFAQRRAIAWSGGSEPVASVDPNAVRAMAEAGIDISGGYSKPWTEEVLLGADVVVTMGCGDACPLFDGKRYEDWDIPDPIGRTYEDVREIRDEIAARVEQLLTSVGLEVEPTGISARSAPPAADPPAGRSRLRLRRRARTGAPPPGRG